MMYEIIKNSKYIKIIIKIKNNINLKQKYKRTSNK